MTRIMDKAAWPVYGLAIVLVAVMLLAAYAVKANHDREEQIEAARVERVEQLNRINVEQCKSLQNLYRVIARTIAESDAAVSQIAYYKEHPEEARRVHEANQRTLEMFRTPPCPKAIEIE